MDFLKELINPEIVRKDATLSVVGGKFRRFMPVRSPDAGPKSGRGGLGAACSPPHPSSHGTLRFRQTKTRPFGP
jgi:hypothetical protein